MSFRSSLKSAMLRLAVAAICGTTACPVRAQTPLTLEAKIPLGEVRGRIDHLAVDLGRRRLFVAELENDSVGVVDLDAGKVAHVIAEVKRPQGVGYLASTDTLYVANGGDGVLRLFAGEGYRTLAAVPLGEDADNVRIDQAAKRVFVGYGEGAIAVIDAASGQKVGDVPLGSHPESFQIDRRMNRIFVNEPKRQLITVLDPAAGQTVAAWSIGNSSNFPMALNDAADHVLVVYRNPAKLAAFAAATGALLTSQETCGDADDMFVDARRRKVYVSCGEGFIDVFDVQDGKYVRVGQVPTVAGARTSLFVPELDRLFLAVRATPQEPAAIWVFRPAP